jgi:integrase/recombinase XerD
MARDLEAVGRIENKVAPLIKVACDEFVTDAKVRGLRDPSIYKYKLLFSRLQTFADNRGLVFISDIDVARAAEFRNTWTNKGAAAQKKLEALRTFFKFCQSRKWLSDNPAAALKMPKNTEAQIEPFTSDEIKKIIAAIASYPDRENAIRLMALVLLLRHSGLRLGDAVTLPRDRISSHKLLLRTEKTGTMVWVPLPRSVTEAIDKCPGKYPFWSGNGKRKSVVGNWQRALKLLFKLADVKHGHAHRFRHSYACELLMAGVSLTNVARLLGHSSEKITEKHYSAWVKGWQDQLEADVRRAFPFDFESDSVITTAEPTATNTK